jgi:hypothetical protein
LVAWDGIEPPIVDVQLVAGPGDTGSKVAYRPAFC